MTFIIGLLIGGGLVFVSGILEFLFSKIVNTPKTTNDAEFEKRHMEQIRFTNSKIRLLSYSKLIDKNLFDDSLNNTILEDFEKFKKLTPDHIHNERCADFIEQAIIKYGSGNNYVIVSCNIFAS